MPVRTNTKLHLTTDSSSSKCTPPNPQTIGDSARRSRSARLVGTGSARPASVGNRAPPLGARRAERAMDAGEPFFHLFDCSLPLAADRAGKPPGARSGASDDDGGFEAPRIAPRCPGRTNEQTRCSSASERGRQRLKGAILASGASNQALREQDTKGPLYDPAHGRQRREDCADHGSLVRHW
jgi:hypothetical protein